MRAQSREGATSAQGQPVMGLIAVMRRALTYWRPYRVQGLLIVVAMLLQQGFNTFLALSLKLIIDTALAAGDSVLLLWILAGLAGGVFLALPAHLFADHLTAPGASNILKDLSLPVVSPPPRPPLDFFASVQA